MGGEGAPPPSGSETPKKPRQNRVKDFRVDFLEASKH